MLPVFSILTHLDGSGLFSLGFWRDDGRRYIVASRVLESEMERIKEEFAEVCTYCRGLDPALRRYPAIRLN